MPLPDDWTDDDWLDMIKQLQIDVELAENLAGVSVMAMSIMDLQRRMPTSEELNSLFRLSNRGFIGSEAIEAWLKADDDPEMSAAHRRTLVRADKYKADAKN
jgi:hypothetical protein